MSAVQQLVNKNVKTLDESSNNESSRDNRDNEKPFNSLLKDSSSQTAAVFANEDDDSSMSSIDLYANEADKCKTSLGKLFYSSANQLNPEPDRK